MKLPSSFHRSLLFRLSLLVGLLLLLSGGVLFTSTRTVERFETHARQLSLLQEGNARMAQLLLLVYQRFEAAPDDQARVSDAIREEMKRMDERYQALTLPDGAPVAGDAEVQEALRRRRDVWARELRPALERVLAVAPREAGRTDLRQLGEASQRYLSDLHSSVGTEQTRIRDEVKSGRWLAILLPTALLALVALTLLLARNLSQRVRSLTDAAERVASGELDVRGAVKGDDEIAVLSRAFDTMTSKLQKNIQLEREARYKLEELLKTIAETTSRLGSATHQILSSTTQQAAGAQQQLAAVSQTMASLEELTRTSESTAGHVGGAVETARRSDELGKQGRGTLDDAVRLMSEAKDRADGVAESILALAEQAQAVGDITALITDVAEQTNVLAINAAIEATRAGEHGRGFAIVASEVKSLADQARRSTAQVRQVLGEIQKMANRCVLTTEEGTRSMETAMRVATQAGESIRALASLGSELAQVLGQVNAAARQQAAGIAQINLAARNIHDVANQYVKSSQEAGAAAQDLARLGDDLRQLFVSTDGLKSWTATASSMH
jgi:methyl-accepting chemotaxis protein